MTKSINQCNIMQSLPFIPNERWFSGLEPLLSDSEGVKLFHDYLRSVHKSEHLEDFWFACKGFRSHADLDKPDKLFQVAKIIYRTYVKSDADQPLILPSTIKRSIVDKLTSYSRLTKSSQMSRSIAVSKIERSLFDEAQNYIKDLLESRFYPDFLKFCFGDCVTLSHVLKPGSTTASHSQFKRSKSFNNSSSFASHSSSISSPMPSDPSIVQEKRHRSASMTPTRVNKVHESRSSYSEGQPAIDISPNTSNNKTNHPLQQTSVTVPELGPTQPSAAGNVRERQMMATNQPSAFASLLATRLEKMKQSRHRMEKLLHLVNPVDQKPTAATSSVTDFSIPQSPAYMSVVNSLQQPVLDAFTLCPAVDSRSDQPAQDILDDHWSRIWPRLRRCRGRSSSAASSCSSSSSGHGSAAANQHQQQHLQPHSSSSRDTSSTGPLLLTSSGYSRRRRLQRPGAETRSIKSDSSGAFDSGISSTTTNYDRLPLASSSSSSMMLGGGAGDSVGQQLMYAQRQLHMAWQAKQQQKFQQQAPLPFLRSRPCLPDDDIARTSLRPCSSSPRTCLHNTKATRPLVNQQLRPQSPSAAATCCVRPNILPFYPPTLPSHSGQLTTTSPDIFLAPQWPVGDWSQASERPAAARLPPGGDGLLDHWLQIQTSASPKPQGHHRSSKLKVNKGVPPSKTVATPSCYSAVADYHGVAGSMSEPEIVIGYYLCDDPVPYRTLWTAGSTAALLNLGQFKHLIAKKGSYRYFFKKPSNEFGTGLVHEELTDDDALLPLVDGKVIARIERAD